MREGHWDRIFGVETEFGCLVSHGLGSPEAAVALVKDHLFQTMRVGLLDLHSRDEVFEPAGSGGFLTNGGRLYIDSVGSHLEYATAECRRLSDLVANDRAGQRLIVRALRELELQGEVDFYNNSVDHFGGHTFGCHENYLAHIHEEFFTEDVALLLPFLVTRQIFAGVGRVGGHILVSGLPDYRTVARNPVDYIWVNQAYDAIPDPEVPFQLSQRSDHILKTVASRVRFNRAIINPKWEHFYDHGGMNRFHLLFGEANQSEYAYALKVGTTLLVLMLVEKGCIPGDLLLAEPLLALRQVSRDQTYRWPVAMADGKTIPAVDVQRRYLQLAQRYRGCSKDVDWTLDEWESTLDGLEKDPMSLGDRLDWVAKRQVLDLYMAENNLDWASDALHSVDLEYHNIDPDRSLFHALPMRRLVDDLDIIDSMTDPPQNTRAKGRGERVSQVLKKRTPRYYLFDWSLAAQARGNYEHLTDPYETYSLVEPE